MSFVSYAQNYEDVMLSRALRDVENGFYVDIGAAWPDEHSVTNAFYLRGWSGINVEPNPAFHSLLAAQRDRDTNLQVAIGSQSGSATLNLITDTGLSTLDDAIANTHRQSGWQSSSITVNTLTLASLLQQHVPANQPVHFLKVDVEGHEATVLASHNWQTCRPWIVLVEATLPMTQQESYADWEPLLTGQSYHFVYADGLNRFYLAQEQLALQTAFRHPPNVFDDFVPQKQVEAIVRGELLQTELTNTLASTQQKIVLLHEQRQHEEQRLAAIIQQTELRAVEAQQLLQQKTVSADYWHQFAKQREQQIEDIRRSRSWKLTEPFRRWQRSYQKRRVKLFALLNRNESTPAVDLKIGIAPARQSWGPRTFKRLKNSVRKRLGYQRPSPQIAVLAASDPVVTAALHSAPGQLSLLRQLRMHHASAQKNLNNRFD